MNIQSIITSVAALQNPSQSDSENPDQIYSLDANFSEFYKFKKVGVRHITLPPGRRSSHPHAESLEEEFVFILQGDVDVWLNGYIYKMNAGWAVGFPAGTGIAHTFINNSDQPVQLLVAGERTKKENLCSFPMNPELKSSSSIWWEDYPPQEFGPHNGLPGPVSPDAIRKTPPSYAAYVPELLKTRKPGFHYVSDNETFDEGVRLTNALGLKALGIWFQILPPGRRSCYPHAHTHEEEFVFVLSGSPKLWLNGFAQELKPQQASGFNPGTGDAHCLINDSSEAVTYIGIGETEDYLDEKIFYPLNAFRTQECQRKNWHWIDRPQREFGSHNGRPQQPYPEHLRFRICADTDTDAKTVLKIFEASTSYFLKVDGVLPNLKMVKHAMIDGPKNTSETYLKEFILIEYKGEEVGVIDLHMNHPENGVAYIGLLLIQENLFGQGLGRKCFELAQDYLKRSFAINKIKLGVSDDNDVSPFWKAMGFSPNGRTYSWQGEAKVTQVTEFEKQIP